MGVSYGPFVVSAVMILVRSRVRHAQLGRLHSCKCVPTRLGQPKFENCSWNFWTTSSAPPAVCSVMASTPSPPRRTACLWDWRLFRMAFSRPDYYCGCLWAAVFSVMSFINWKLSCISPNTRSHQLTRESSLSLFTVKNCNFWTEGWEQFIRSSSHKTSVGKKKKVWPFIGWRLTKVESEWEFYLMSEEISPRHLKQSVEIG